MPSRPVSVRIFHREPGPEEGRLVAWVAERRLALAQRQVAEFRGAGAADISIVSGPPDDTPFGARLRGLVDRERPAGLIVLGSGAVPLATDRDLRDLVAVAGSERPEALTNNRFSGDVVAISCADALLRLPDLPGDNALPRWLEEAAGYSVRDLRSRWRLSFDVDGPLELVLLGQAPPASVELGALRARLAAVRAVAEDRRSELLVAGRVSRRTLAWLETGVPARIRALVEERGLRAASVLVQGGRASGGAAVQRPPASTLGLLLEREGPVALGSIVARLGEAAILDTRVLLTHRLGVDERTWPVAEDRFASDLLLPDRIDDPWLRDLTQAALDAPIPVILGGHSVVDSGTRMLLSRGRQPWM
jgi:hypothetical protein